MSRRGKSAARVAGREQGALCARAAGRAGVAQKLVAGAPAVGLVPLAAGYFALRVTGGMGKRRAPQGNSR